MSYEKPIPLKTQDNRPYWDAADQHELVIQTCESCTEAIHPPGPSCPHCGSEDVGWQKLGSDIEGTVYSYIVSYRPFLPGFQNDIPHIIAQVELAQNPKVKIIGNILKCEPEDIKIGMPVKMIWEDITEDRALPQWIAAD